MVSVGFFRIDLFGWNGSTVSVIGRSSAVGVVIDVFGISSYIIFEMGI